MTIAQQLGITKFPFIIKSGKRAIYKEHADGFWVKWKFNKKGQETHYEDSEGAWMTYQYDDKGNLTRFEDSFGNWSIWSGGNVIETFGVDSKSKKSIS
jgi:YD repeat-containing protein